MTDPSKKIYCEKDQPKDRIDRRQESYFPTKAFVASPPTKSHEADGYDGDMLTRNLNGLEIVYMKKP